MNKEPGWLGVLRALIILMYSFFTPQRAFCVRTVSLVTQRRFAKNPTCANSPCGERTRRNTLSSIIACLKMCSNEQIAAGQSSLTESQHHLSELLGKVTNTRVGLPFSSAKVFSTSIVIFRTRSICFVFNIKLI